jgi:hypothetical protein
MRSLYDSKSFNQAKAEMNNVNILEPKPEELIVGLTSKTVQSIQQNW